jgi:predicted Zn-dependent protease with MMP-like domain
VSDQELEDLLRGFDECLQAEDAAGAGARLAQLRAALGEDHPEALYTEARLCVFEEDWALARELLERVLQLEPDHADAHYELACVAEAEDDRAAMIEHFLRAHELDAELDEELGMGSEEELQHIEEVAREVLEGLPAMFAERLSHVPVLIEPRPARPLVQEGFDPRAFGLFDGPTDGVRDEPAPTRIVLYSANLLADFPDEPSLSEQIEVTVLHEVGHFFGLDEEQLERLGLD